MKLALVTYRRPPSRAYPGNGTAPPSYIVGQVLAQTAEKLVIAPMWRATGEDEAYTIPTASIVKIQTLVPQKG